MIEDIKNVSPVKKGRGVSKKNQTFSFTYFIKCVTWRKEETESVCLQKAILGPVHENIRKQMGSF